MEQALLGMQKRMVMMEQEILVQRGMNTSLQQVIANGVGASQPVRSGVDTRGLGKPEMFEGTTAKWRDWKVAMRSYTAACHGDVADLMKTSESTEDP